MWMSDGRDCAGELRQSLSVEDVDGKQDSLSYCIESNLVNSQELFEKDFDTKG